MPQFASLSDAQVWAQTEDLDPSLVRSANLMVASALRLDVYTVDGFDLPTDPVVRQAVRDAACAQATAWHTLGVNPAAGAAGDQGVPTSSGIGGATVTYAVAASAATARATAAETLCHEAAQILRAAGLMAGHPRIW